MKNPEVFDSAASSYRAWRESFLAYLQAVDTGINWVHVTQCIESMRANLITAEWMERFRVYLKFTEMEMYIAKTNFDHLLSSYTRGLIRDRLIAPGLDEVF